MGFLKTGRSEIQAKATSARFRKPGLGCSTSASLKADGAWFNNFSKPSKVSVPVPECLVDLLLL